MLNLPIILDVGKKISTIVEYGIFMKKGATPRQNEPSGGSERLSKRLCGGVQSVTADRPDHVISHLCC